MKASPAYFALIDAGGGETAGLNQRDYRGTISRVLPGSAAAPAYRDLGAVRKEELITIIRDCCDDPAGTAGSAGRPRKRTGSPIDCVVVVQEKHADGSRHFHFVVKLLWPMRFKQAKETMQKRHALPSHWSCKRSQMHTAVSYVALPTPKKPEVASPTGECEPPSLQQ